MYAAAGGASLASRQARQRQRQTKKAAAQKASKASDFLPKPPQKTQFPNYTDDNIPRLSRVERQALSLKPPQLAHERRHSTSNYHLKEPRARIRESPSICIPVQNHLNDPQKDQPLTPCTLVHNHLPVPHSPTLPALLPQILIPEDGDKSLERRCSFVRQVEEKERCPEGGTGVLDRCNHMCNFEIKEKGWENNPEFYAEYDRSLFGSLEYPASEISVNIVDNLNLPINNCNVNKTPCKITSTLKKNIDGVIMKFGKIVQCSQGRAAWQERERGRRCSLTDEARQHRLKQNEAHHRWMKRNRIHDTTYGGSSEEEDFFDVYHQSAAANALLYVGLGTSAIGSVIFFVGTGEKGFKTLELRLIGPTLIACGLLCCLIRVLLCACPSNCFRRRKKTRLKNVCPHSSSRYPLNRGDRPPKRTDHGAKKKVSIVTNNPNPVPSTSTGNFQEERLSLMQADHHQQQYHHHHQIPIITGPDPEGPARRVDSLIELDNLNDASYELQSVSSADSDTVIEVECRKESKHVRTREPAYSAAAAPQEAPSVAVAVRDVETSLSVVIERCDDGEATALRRDEDRREAHSGIVLSPLQLGQ